MIMTIYGRSVDATIWVDELSAVRVG